jgi:uncharacterized protein YbaP (TraB family)
VGAVFGLTEEILNMYKPWALFSTFGSYSANLTTSTEEVLKAQQLGIDMKFLMDAYFYGKPIVELESYEFQLEMFDSFSDELEELLLSSTLDSINNIMQGTVTDTYNPIASILDYWHEGDVDGFMKEIAPLMIAAETPDMDEEDKEILPLMDEYFNKIFTQRDKVMADKIDILLGAEGSATYFIVVGTGHYISDNSVVDILKDMGYEVNQIK